MSRDKENNNPVPRQPRAVGSIFIGKQPTPPSAEFFTDSIIDDTSRIPSPSPLKKKNALSRPRRVVSQSKAPAFTKAFSDVNGRAKDAGKHGIRHQQPAPTLQRPLSMRSSHSDLITPPQSRDGPNSLQSPTSEASNPPQDLTDTYQRIYDEEILADTERDVLSSDSDEGNRSYQQDRQPRQGSPSPNPRVNHHTMPETQQVRSATPETLPHDADKENIRDDHTGAFSEGSGMSFLNQLTDQNLAAKATPLVSSHVKDMKRLHQGISTRPISFNAGTKPSEFIADDARSNASSDRSSRSSRRRGQRANVAVTNGVSGPQHSLNRAASQHNSPSLTPRDSARTQPTDPVATLSQRQPLRELPVPSPDHEGHEPIVHEVSDSESDVTSPELLERERQFELSRARKFFGIPASSAVPGNANKSVPSSTQPEPSQADVEDRHEDPEEFARHSGQNEQPQTEGVPSTRIPITNKGILKKWRQSAAEQRAERTQDTGSEISSSAVDWLGVDADAPLPSIEADTNHEADDLTDAESPRLQRVSNLRKFENETTGMSFQVSESPPVRQRKSIDDLAREREIDQLSRQAVTKSRLEAIREKDPREAHRRLSRSPSGSSLRKSVSHETGKKEEHQAAGEQIPDTPIMVFRSSGGSSKSIPRSDHDRRTSHDALQRFARLSATPKSSPSLPPKDDLVSAKLPDTQTADAAELLQPKKPAVAATPKVSGAWTDTILPPGTIGTVAQSEQLARYAQTPHVNAGGWVDTPLPHNSRKPDVPESIDEAPKEMTTDIAAAVANDLKQLREAAEAEKRPQIGQSALTNILAAQRIRDPDINDTLNLGETTIASLEDLVDLNEEDMTTLIRMGAEHDALQQLRGADTNNARVNGTSDSRPLVDGGEAEIIVLDRLAKKLQTLQANIRHARKAASRFEREMSEGVTEVSAHGPPSATAVDGQGAKTAPTQAVSKDAPFEPTVINRNGYLPLTFAPLQIPLPLLIRPPPATNAKHPVKTGSGLRNKLAHRRGFGRPTPLLYLLLALLFYRFLEIFLSEIYAHPLYAESYSWPDTIPIASTASSPSHTAGRDRFVVVKEPEPGFVIPSLIARNLWGGDAEGVKQFVEHARDGVGSMISSTLEWFDAVDDNPHREDADPVSSPREASAFRKEPVADEQGWSMLDDEVL